jgi:AcrR family transcriptional regulator
VGRREVRARFRYDSFLEAVRSGGHRVPNDVDVRVEVSEPCAGRKRGRPLDTARDEAILGATIALLGERGFDRFTVKDIAERAGAGLGAIYRRWPGKLDVVVAAIRLLEESTPPVPITGDAATDLEQVLMSAVRNLRGCHGAIIPGLISAMRDNPELAALLRESAFAPRLDVVRTILTPVFADAVERDLRAEMALSLLLHRFLLAGKLPTQREIRDQLVPLILDRPLTTGKRLAKRGRRAAS